MKNYEKYADKIKKYKDSKDEYFCNEFIIPHILKKDSCAGIGCEHCHMLQLLWLMEEYEEPEVDWSNVEVDTPILVRTVEGADWVKRSFAKYEGGMVYVWNNGKTSWTALDNECVTPWQYAKLAESEEE